MSIEKNGMDVTGEVMSKYGDAKLPYDIKIGSVLFREGTKLSTFCTAAERWFNMYVLTRGNEVFVNGENPKDALWDAIAQNRKILDMPPQAPPHKPSTIERKAQKIIEYIWGIWYGHHRGVMNSDQMSDLLIEAKRKIIILAESAPYKPETEAEMTETASS